MPPSALSQPVSLREFAERVLHGASLESKLACPDVIVDNDPGAALATPREPGRPRELKFAKGGSGFKLPGLRALERDAARGRLLHFFANHELLATELMALVLLKFPDAPQAFRRGVLQTLKDEQRHTRLYVERLRALGVEFGEHPVNGYFWNIVSPMASPMEYVSRLALTFEQANLDFSAYYAGLFAQLGDEPSRAILEQIHRDEIAHVGYGLKWFRRWKDPALSDWEAFQLQLPYPLSPTRAKAAPFNASARLKAGLDPDFIEHLLVYSKSKGRPPTVLLFNPLAELTMGRHKHHHPKSGLRALERDLANLPQFLCGKDDVVLVPQPPRPGFLKSLQQSGFTLPQFEVLRRGRLEPGSELPQRKIGALRPWAWCPESLDILQPLASQLTAGSSPPPADWSRRFQPLYSKAWAAEFLRQILANDSHPDWLCPPDTVGLEVTTPQDALDAIEQLRARGYRRLVAKSLYGLAGNNQLRLWEPDTLKSQENWIRRVLRNEGALLIEPWLDRVLDFSAQYDRTADGLRFLGLVRMDTDARGQYAASTVAPRFTMGLDAEVAAWAHGGGVSAGRLPRWYEALMGRLEPRLAEAGFTGALGIDAFVYRDASGGLRLKPIVEINPRYTLGRVALELMRHTSAGCVGRLELIGRPGLRRLGLSRFTDLAADLARRHPPQRAGSPKPLLSGGAVCLNDPATAESVLAVWRVTPCRNA